MAGRVIEAAVRRLARPFEWGVCDCCLGVCDVLVDLGYPDPAAIYRGLYCCESGAKNLMGGGVEAVAERECLRLRWPEIDAGDAQPGDVGVSARSLAIRLETGVWAVKGPHGIAMREKVRRAWRPRK